LFESLGLAERIKHQIGDVTDPQQVFDVVERCQPEFIFHLAAQSLVRPSYQDPVSTYATNVMGTVHLLDAVRRLNHPCSVVVVTTDKCYENREWVHSYREEDAMGGFDPYSSSKGAAEIVVAAFRRSYFMGSESGIGLATARAGNVIGGGDWAQDRIVPDCVRALQSRQAVPVRNKIATRPWQHVLEPLSGYLHLASSMHHARQESKKERLQVLSGPFNFGPALTSNRTVADLVIEILKHWPGSWEDQSDPQAPHEAKLLNLATDKAFHHLLWKPVWNFEQTIENTVSWYRQSLSDAGAIKALTAGQINAYTRQAKTQSTPWAD
jgi:CDP-glucose 4,6-dehydratase